MDTTAVSRSGWASLRSGGSTPAEAVGFVSGQVEIETRSPPAAPVVLNNRGRVRVLSTADIPHVATVFQRVFRKREARRIPRLERHLAALYLDHPHFSQDNASLVYERPDGRIAGFLGVIPVRMRFDDAPFTAVATGTWMVEDPLVDPHAGVALVRAHTTRKHVMSLSDTVSAASFRFQRRIHVDFLPAHSLRWIRPLNFAAYAALKLGERLGGLHQAGVVGAAYASEDWARRAVGHHSDIAPPAGWETKAVSVDAFARSYLDLVARFRLRPDWTPTEIVWMLNLAGERQGSGFLRLVELRDPKGALAGCYLYFARPRQRAEVVQVLIRPNAEEEVVRSLLSDARGVGCVAASGQTDPSILKGLSQIRKVHFRQVRGTTILTKQAGLRVAMISGDGVIGGLVGDSWSPVDADPYL